MFSKLNKRRMRCTGEFSCTPERQNLFESRRQKRRFNSPNYASNVTADQRRREFSEAAGCETRDITPIAITPNNKKGQSQAGLPP
jgi:hypothetical protein